MLSSSGAAASDAGAAASGNSSVRSGASALHGPWAFSLLPCFQTLTTSMSRARVAAT